MIIKTGIDLVEIERMKKSLQNPRFLTRVFSDFERGYFTAKGSRTESLAANFAAKEAFSKALGTGIRGFWLTDISVLRDQLGAPYFVLDGKAKELAEGWTFSVSLTHTDCCAGAVVVAYHD